MDKGLEILIMAMQDDLKELRSDVRSLIEWRWKLAGILTVITIICTVVFQTVLAFIQRGG